MTLTENIENKIREQINEYAEVYTNLDHDVMYEAAVKAVKDTFIKYWDTDGKEYRLDIDNENDISELIGILATIVIYGNEHGQIPSQAVENMIDPDTFLEL